MALTEPQAKVLAALAILGPMQSLTVRELCGHAGRKDSATRAALRGLADSGLAHGSRPPPARWRITARGRALLLMPRYREYLSQVSANRHRR
ncbi:hypothetical protein [Nocardia pseudovaccinii]|uniref:hypothetical protein n=1 Tax=Nocardia pseudovaccinii TaxID=189540 RepID=UPI0007A39F32|nr:hypothetical protein [Nocardia pseudovaccinii]